MLDPSDVAAFHETVRELRGRVSVPGLKAPLEVSDSDIDSPG
jgi:hypothetical protein